MKAVGAVTGRGNVFVNLKPSYHQRPEKVLARPLIPGQPAMVRLDRPDCPSITSLTLVVEFFKLAMNKYKDSLPWAIFLS